MLFDFFSLSAPADYTDTTIPVAYTSTSPTQMCVTIPLENDDLFESAEVFLVELSNLQGTIPVAPTTVPVIVEDDDGKS